MHHDCPVCFEVLYSVALQFTIHGLTLHHWRSNCKQHKTCSTYLSQQMTCLWCRVDIPFTRTVWRRWGNIYSELTQRALPSHLLIQFEICLRCSYTHTHRLWWQICLPPVLEIRLWHVQGVGKIRHWDCFYTNARTLSEQNGQFSSPLSYLFLFMERGDWILNDKTKPLMDTDCRFGSFATIAGRPRKCSSMY